MGEHERLQRLEALGIDVYVRRGTPTPAVARPGAPGEPARGAAADTDPSTLGWSELRALRLPIPRFERTLHGLSASATVQDLVHGWDAQGQEALAQ